PRGRGAARRRPLAAGMGHPLERERCKQDRQRDVGAENRRRRRDRPDVDKDARAELQPLERRDVLAKRELVTRAAEEVGGGFRVELLLREALVVADVERHAHATSLTAAPSSV